MIRVYLNNTFYISGVSLSCFLEDSSIFNIKSEVKLTLDKIPSPIRNFFKYSMESVLIYSLTDSNESHQSTDKNKSYLNNFSSEKIEYARVWYQLISTKNDLKGIRNVYVTKIPKGSKVNPQAQDSAVYKEDVVKLEAPMKAGGSVTYSSNGDGTINVYNSIPYKWESPQNSDYSQMDKITKKAIENNVETIYIKPYDNKTVAKLANKVKYNK
ncbi:hypothetical protein [Staphylococcus arlettae]|uniref:hypothetical protein n=1 Tax=Staphylococcus arlettae TaxID=29378 RepID=UPI001D167A78|nr:hypothetical protein [Staphylococcus arlettae]